MNIITQEQLKNLKSGEKISGILLIKGYSIQTTKTQQEYITGQVQSGVDVYFKAWNNSPAFTSLKNEAYENVPSFISATVDDYRGQLSLVLDTVQAVAGYTPDQFFPIKYNIEAYWDALKTLVSQRVSSKGQVLCNKVLFENEEVASRFKVEFAAKAIHDNCKGGLLAHTYKVFNTVLGITATYPDLVKREGMPDSDTIDLLLIGALFHDLGKIRELNFGVYQPESVVTHCYHGMEIVSQFKADFVAAYNEVWYFNLASILLQHHGEFGEPCRTVVANIVHMADMLDARMTSLAQLTSAANYLPDTRVKVDGTYLTL